MATLSHIGRFELLEEVGRGSMGVVYRARDREIERIVALKIILTASLGAEQIAEYKQRFRREAQAAGRMSHPGIITIFDMAEDELGQPYLVMEYVEGAPLERFLAPGGDESGGGTVRRRSNLAQTLDLAIQIAEALGYAHSRGVVHRDIKPANILVTADWRAKIADFGIAKLKNADMTHAEQLLGTPAFMSPEQFSGGAVDARSDIFSLGAVFYWMCTGEKPFPGDNMTAVAFKIVHTSMLSATHLNPTLPPGMDAILTRCLEKRPEARYGSCDELVADLKRLIDLPGPAPAGVVGAEAGFPASQATQKTKEKPASRTTLGAAPKTPPSDATVLLPANDAVATPAVHFEAARGWLGRQILSASYAAGRAIAAAARAAWRMWLTHVWPAIVGMVVAALGFLWRQLLYPALAWVGEQFARAGRAIAEAMRRFWHQSLLPRLAAAWGHLWVKIAASAVALAALATLGLFATRAIRAIRARASNAGVSFVLQPRAEEATLQVELRHDLRGGVIEVAVDGRDVAFNDLLPSETRGADSFAEISARIPAGQHNVRVRVRSREDDYSEEAEISGDFSENSERRLVAEVDRSSAAHLFRRHLTLHWSR